MLVYFIIRLYFIAILATGKKYTENHSFDHWLRFKDLDRCK